MQRFYTQVWTRSIFLSLSLLACSIMAMTSGCASGGFKLTRQYASWVNSQNIILRIVLYILTSIVFAVTMLIDLVIFNTMDFWEGRVSAGSYNFKEGDKTYFVEHKFMPGTKLRHSTIQVEDKNHIRLQEVVLNETPSGEIELIVDGKIRSRVRNISSLPIASVFNDHGLLIEEKVLLFTTPSTVLAHR